MSLKRTGIWFLAVWAAVLAVNFSCLLNPPYWDDIIGLHNQAKWYADNHFAIIELWSKPASEYSSNIYP